MRSIPILTLSIVANGAIGGNRFVNFADQQLAVAGGAALGVAEYPAAAAGKQVAVHVLGTARIESGGAIARHALFKADAQGRAIAYDGTGEILGRSLQAVGGAGVVFEGLLLPSRGAA